jgi:hypothetical protein
MLPQTRKGEYPQRVSDLTVVLGHPCTQSFQSLVTHKPSSSAAPCVVSPQRSEDTEANAPVMRDCGVTILPRLADPKLRRLTMRSLGR